MDKATGVATVGVAAAVFKSYFDTLFPSIPVRRCCSRCEPACFA
jgi:hypothetical protein